MNGGSFQTIRAILSSVIVFGAMPLESSIFGRRAAREYLRRLRGDGNVSAESASIRKDEKCGYERYKSIQTRHMETNARGMRLTHRHV